MSFKWLTQEALQDAVGVEILNRLEALAPVLNPGGSDIVQLYRKSNLVKLLEAFGTAHLMRNRDFFRKYLYAIPGREFDQLCAVADIGHGGGTYEERLDALLRKGWKAPAYCSRVCEVLGLPADVVPAPKSQLSETMVVDQPRRPFKQLLDYQYPIMLQCMDRLHAPRARAVLQMPTGAGKTRTALEIIAAHLNESVEDRRVVWLAHSEELCEQAIACAIETWEHLGSYDLRIGRIFGGRQARPEPHRSEFLVASFQSLYARSQRGVPWDNEQFPISLVVVDEAHKVLAPTYRLVTESLVGESTKVLGLTATPGRGADDQFGNRELAAFFFDTIVSLVGPRGENAIEYLRRQRVLANADQEIIESPTAYVLTDDEKRAIEKTHDYPPGLLRRIGSDDFRNLEILKKLREATEAGGQCLFFGCSVEHSKFVCALLNYLGIGSRHVDGTTEKGERRAAIDDFRDGALRVLCNYGVLATGFDAPKTDVVFISRPTKSIVLYSQMLGRGLRGPRVGGTERCKIINVRDNFLGMPSNDEIFEYFSEYWNGGPQ